MERKITKSLRVAPSLWRRIEQYAERAYQRARAQAVDAEYALRPKPGTIAVRALELGLAALERREKHDAR